MSPSGKSKPDFETALKELEKIVETLEDGDLPLEKAVQEWEKGMKLHATCQKTLTKAEQKVDVLMKKSSGYEAEPLDPED